MTHADYSLNNMDVEWQILQVTDVMSYKINRVSSQPLANKMKLEFFESRMHELANCAEYEYGGLSSV